MCVRSAASAFHGCEGGFPGLSLYGSVTGKLHDCLAENGPIGFPIPAMAVVFPLLHFLYVFPLEARYDDRLLMDLSDARKLFIRHAHFPAGGEDRRRAGRA